MNMTQALAEYQQARAKQDNAQPGSKEQRKALRKAAKIKGRIRDHFNSKKFRKVGGAV